MGRITREFIQQHRGITFVYGASVHFRNPDPEDSQEGTCWREPNTVGVPTCFWYCPMGRQDSMFHDSMFAVVTKHTIDLALAKITQPAVYLPKIGAGCSGLKQRCPKTYQYLISKLDALCLNNSINEAQCLQEIMNNIALRSLVMLNPSWMVKELAGIKAICGHGVDSNTKD